MEAIKLFYLGITSLVKWITHSIKYFCIGIVSVTLFIPHYFIIGIEHIIKKINKKNGKDINFTNEKKDVSFAVIGFTLSVYLICVFLTSKWSVQSMKVKYLANDIINSTEIIEKEEKPEPPKEEKPVEKPVSPTPPPKPVYYPNDYWDYLSVPFIDVNFDELLKKNPDTVGWIKVEGTKVNYPVTQSNDNKYYLHHAFNRRQNIGGWIYADYRVNFKDFGKNTIIYGHNMNNKTMFGSIPSMLNSRYLNNAKNYHIKISTPTCNTVWKVFSIYTIEPEVYYLKTNFKKEPFEKFIGILKDRSIKDFGIDVNADDKILTLSTCDNSGTKRVAVHAKMVNIEYK